MPYIRQELRDELESEAFRSLRPESPGELTYLVVRLYDQYVAQHGVGPESKAGFSIYAAGLGALEAAKLEIYRRRIAPYEDEKIRENGDV